MCHNSYMKQILTKLAVLISVPVVVATAYSFSQQKPEKEMPAKAEEVRAEKTQPTIANDTIAPTVTTEPTKTPTTTSTLKPTQNPVTPTATKTPEPTPTEYLKNPNPTTPTQEMENKICKIYGAKDCFTVIKWAEAENVRLSPTFQMSARNGLGVLALDCTYGTRKLMKKEDMTDEAFLEYCRSIIFDPEVNIRVPLELYQTKGIDAVTEYLRFGIVR